MTYLTDDTLGTNTGRSWGSVCSGNFGLGGISSNFSVAAISTTGAGKDAVSTGMGAVAAGAEGQGDTNFWDGSLEISIFASAIAAEASSPLEAASPLVVSLPSIAWAAEAFLAISETHDSCIVSA